MADHSEKDEYISKKTTDKTFDLERNTFDSVDDIFSKVKDISILVTKARIKAKEAEVRAMYSLQFAERAVEEAKSAHAVSESLAKTSQVVATLALQITNDADYLTENMNYQDDFFAVSEVATQTLDPKEAETNNAAEGGSTLIGKISNPVTDNCKLETNLNKEITSKFDAVYPHDLRTDDMKNQYYVLQQLPVLSEEESSQSPRLDSGEYEDKSSDDVKRTMRLYKDSKLVKTNLRRTMETGDAYTPIYQENGTQTCH